MRSLRCVIVLATVLSFVPGPIGHTASTLAASSVPTPACNLGSGIQHVIYIQFDNVHLRRDAASVPSDLEQMPNLLNFVESNGVMLDKHFTPLIAHTADDIVTSMSGLYGDRQGIPEANSYGFYTGAGTKFQSSFAYWTDTISDGTFNMLDTNRQNAPAPWTPFTTAGCNDGAVASANTELEGTNDVANVYGTNSPQAHETGAQESADFVGIAVHCARGASLCATNGVPDVLPSAPAYTGYAALYGHKYVAPAIGGTGPGGVSLTDLDGNLIADTSTGTPIPGFPGYDGMTAPVSLAYTLDMQTHGVQVTHTYISAAHVDPATGNDAGPGSAGYAARLRDYNKAFGTFFSELANNGITTRNTLFVITTDENDQFVGGAGSPDGCDGVSVPCTYNQIGEIDVNLDPLIKQAGQNTTYSIHFDSAPFVYLNNQPASGSTTVRDFERAMAGLVVQNPITGQNQTLINYFADPVEMKLEHMITADPQRTPSFVAFGKPFYFIQTNYAGCQVGEPHPSAVIECPPSFGADAWMHGTFDPQINQSWLGLVGPGVSRLGLNDQIWSDHTDILPTMLELTGLTANSSTEGRVLWEVMTSAALPMNVRAQESLLVQLAGAYKQINAPVGQFGSDSLLYSTHGIASGTDADDSKYQTVESTIAQLTTQRDSLAAQMAAELNAAAFNGQGVDSATAQAQISEANNLIQKMHNLALNS